MQEIITQATVPDSLEPAVPMLTEVLVPLELKSVTTYRSSRRALDIAKQVGHLCYCDTDSIDRFHYLVPDVSHRAQLFHHAAVTKCSHVLYVVASLGAVGIIRMVLLKFSAARIGSYSTLMHSVSQQAFPWVYNKLKTAVDLLSSYLKHTYIPHKKLDPECVIYERLLLTLLLNCYSGYKCWKGAELLNRNKVCKKKSSGLVGSFPEFLFDLASNLDDKWLQTVFGTDYGANLDRYEDEVCTAVIEAFLAITIT